MYRIIFKANSQVDLNITDEIYNTKVKNSSEEDGFEVKGVWYPFITIDKIQKISAIKKTKPNIIPRMQFNKKIIKREKSLQQMITGLKKYIKSDRYQGGNGPIILLKQWESKLLGISKLSKK